jgi:small GTP-binding protein
MKSLNPPIYKILVLGQSNVGKTCLKLRFIEDSFNLDHRPTIGIDYDLKSVKIFNDEIVKLAIWDSAGQERYRSITKLYLKDSHGIILCFDITDRHSFDELSIYWIELIKDHLSHKKNKNCKLILVGTKLDKQSSRKVNTNEAKMLAENLNISYFETSAMKNINIEELFVSISSDIYKELEKNKSKEKRICRLGSFKNQLFDHDNCNNKKGCC